MGSILNDFFFVLLKLPLGNPKATWKTHTRKKCDAQFQIARIAYRTTLVYTEADTVPSKEG